MLSKIADLPLALFPFTIRFFDGSGSEIRSITVAGPGPTMIPALGHHGEVRVRIEFADGSVTEG